MANDLMAIRDPDEAYLVFKRKGPGGIAGLRPGSIFTITDVSNPSQSISVEVTTPHELVALAQSSPYEFGGYFSDFAAFTERSLIQRFEIRLGLESVDAPLTQDILVSVLSPIISALATTQRVLFGNEPTIRAITQNSPIQVSMEGAGGLYEKIANDVIPWRRERAKQIAALETARSRAELEQKRAEVLAAEAITERERADSDAAYERARQARAEASLKEVELTRARFDLGKVCTT